MGDLVSTGRGVPAQRDADPDLVDVGAEALGVKLMEVGPVPADPHMGLLRDLARSVLEAAADEEREAGMVATRVRSAPGPAGEWAATGEARARAEQAGSVDLMGWAVAVVSSVDAPAAGWPQQTGEWRTAARQWLDAIATQALVPDGQRHPNEQPGRRMSDGQAQLVVCALADLQMWIRSEHELAQTYDQAGVEALDRVLVEVGRRIAFPHVGPNLARHLAVFGSRDD